MASYLDTTGLNHLWIKLKSIFYQKPSGGIPKTDMESTVQTSLGKADSAYQKPSGGIPKSDLASSVQTSLGKADSAIQKHQDISGKLDKSGGTMTGAISMGATANVRQKITMLADPTADYDAVNKKYVDDTVSSLDTNDIKMSASSQHYAGTDILTDVIDGISTGLIHKVDKKYVDDAIAGCLPLAGGDMTGDINMAGNKLWLTSDTSATSAALYQNTSGVWLARPNAEGGYADRYVELKGIFTPTDNYSAANKKYVDDMVAKAIGDAMHLKKEIVSGGTLPEISAASENVIYMLPVSESSSDNSYIEYMKINNKWEQIGSTNVDLSNYVTKTDIVAMTNSEIDAIVDGT